MWLVLVPFRLVGVAVVGVLELVRFIVTPTGAVASQSDRQALTRFYFLSTCSTSILQSVTEATPPASLPLFLSIWTRRVMVPTSFRLNLSSAPASYSTF